MIKHYIKIPFIFLLLMLVFSCSNDFEKDYSTEKKEIDSLYILSANKSLTNNERILLLDSIYNYASFLGDDSLKMKATEEFTKLYYRENNSVEFHKYKNEHIYLSTKYNDLYALAKTYEFGGAYYMNHFQPDSAYYYYYNSYKVYENLKDSIWMGRVLVNLSIIQKNTHDYVGSEATTFKALNYIKSNNNKRRISSLYNNLGLIYSRLKDFDNSIKYHLKALALRKQIDNNTKYVFHSINNIGKAYKDNQQYEKANDFFNRALKYKSYLEQNSQAKAVVIENKTHAQFKNGKTEGVLNSYKNVFSIFYKEKDLDGLIITSIHIAEYYKKMGNTKRAFYFAEFAEKTAKKIHSNEDYLLALELLTSLQETKETKDFYFNKYISVRDSLSLLALKQKDQFARIRFETDAKNQTIQNQKQNLQEKNNYILILGLVLFFTIALIIILYILKKNKTKRLKKKLKDGFEDYLKKKYSLTTQNIEFWNIWIEGYGQEYISQKLHISINAVKSRRKSLKDRISKIEKISDHFDISKAIIIYNKELDLYKNTISKE